MLILLLVECYSTVTLFSTLHSTAIMGTSKEVRPMNQTKQLRKKYTRQFYRGNGLYLLLGVMQSIVLAVAQLYLAWLMQTLVDTATGASAKYSLGQVAIFGVIALGLFMFGSALDYVSRPKFKAKAMRQYRNHVFEALSRKNISAFTGENTSLYLSALTNDANTIEGYLNNIFELIFQVLQFVGALALMFWYSPALTGISIAAAFLPVIASILAGNRMAKAEETVAAKNESFMASLNDSLSGFSVIKSFRAEKEICKQFAQNVKAVANAKCGRDKLDIIISTMGEFAGITAQFAVFFAGAWLAQTGRGASAGMIMAFVQMMNYVLTPIGRVPSILAQRKSANTLVDKLALALNENIRDEGEHIPQTLQDGISLENVTFSYDGDKNALENVSIKFEAGKSYAIVGGSGSGKSTLLNLLMAGYSNYDGAIRYDDKELRSISSESLYELVSLIQQNVFVFNNTVRDNVTMFHEFDNAEVNTALELSGLSEFIARRGADALCGENGCNLSGGEKQRISIARSLLRKSPVLLMDEATAALDNQTAFRVVSSILNLNSLTRIVVTHALDENILRRYDQILTMKSGHLIESGTYDELMEKKGYFYSLYTVSQ